MYLSLLLSLSLSRHFFHLAPDPIKSSQSPHVCEPLALHAGRPPAGSSQPLRRRDPARRCPLPTSSSRRALYSFGISRSRPKVQLLTFQSRFKNGLGYHIYMYKYVMWYHVSMYFQALVWTIHWEACMWLGKQIVSPPSGYILHLVRCFHVPILEG